MSYLHTPRFVFTGDFQSDVSTVNNDPAHYNNSTFQSSFQTPQDAANANGWWNPEGGSVFRLINCRITSLSSTTGDDILAGQQVGGPENAPSGKMLDQDPQQQGSSELWCVKIRIATAENELLLQGQIQTTGFRDLQTRQHDGIRVNGQPMGGSWTSVLTQIEWGAKTAESPLLQSLKSITHENKLSINLNAFGYYYAHAADGRFSLGRIIGCIGPWFSGEPELFAPVRRLYGILNSGTAQRPAIYFSNSNFLFNSKERSLTLDLGASFPIADALGTITLKQSYVLGVLKNELDVAPDTRPVTLTAAAFLRIAEVDYRTGPDWLGQTGGIIQANDLPEEITSLLAHRQLVLLLTSATAPDTFTVLARESQQGYLLRADNFVQRLDSGGTSKVILFAYQYGRPLAHTKISVALEPPTPVTPLGPQNPISEIPGNNYPAEGLEFPAEIVTDQNGRAELLLKGKPIHSPRGYIDGQIYILDYQLKGIPNDPAEGPYSNDTVFIHLRDHFDIPENPAWADIAATMIQYSNLYPIMSRYVVNLADPTALKSKKDILLYAFTRDINDPFYMPVTRDLSEAKRAAIIKWLSSSDEESPPSPTTGAQVPAESPASQGSALTDRQQKLKNAVQAKNGSMLSFLEMPGLYDHLT